MKLRNFFMILLLCMTVGIFGVACTGSDGADGADGAPGMDGADGADGAPGMDGADGENCYDGLALPDDDMDGDGELTVADCRGADGADGMDGADGEDLTVPEPPNPNDCNIMAAVSSATAHFTGTTTDDDICGTENADWINGGGGDDTIFGLAGNDTLMGDIDVADDATTDDVDESAGNTDSDDTLHGGAGDDTLHGGPGRDILNGDAGDDTFRGGEGDDTLNGGDGFDTADYSVRPPDIADDDAAVMVNLATGGEVADAYGDEDTLTNIENVTGGQGNDTLTGDAGPNALNGGAGNDTINGGAGDDILTGGAGVDTINGGAGDDTINGETVVMGIVTVDTDDDEILHGGMGNDTLLVSETVTEAVVLNSEGGIQPETAVAAVDPADDSTALTSSGFENLRGGVALTGNAEDNVLDGERGVNTLRGDTDAADADRPRGEDEFVVWVRSQAAGVINDTILDFQFPVGTTTAIDKIVIKRMPDTEGETTVEIADTAGQISVKTGSITQTILLQSDDGDGDPVALINAVLTSIVGATGKGSQYLIIE